LFIDHGKLFKARLTNTLAYYKNLQKLYEIGPARHRSDRDYNQERKKNIQKNFFFKFHFSVLRSKFKRLVLSSFNKSNFSQFLSLRYPFSAFNIIFAISVKILSNFLVKKKLLTEVPSSFKGEQQVINIIKSFVV